MTELESAVIHEELSIKDIDEIEGFLNKVKLELGSEIYWKYNYLWLERDPFTKFSQIQNIFTHTSKVLDNNSDPKYLTWFRNELFIHAFIAVIDISSICFSIEKNDLYQFIKEKFYNMGTTKEGKMKIKKGTDDLIKLVEELTGGKGQISIPRIEIVPDYIDKLGILTEHIINKSLFIQKYLLTNDFILRSFLHGKSISINALNLPKGQTDDMKYINDLLLRILHNGPINFDFNNYL